MRIDEKIVHRELHNTCFKLLDQLCCFTTIAKKILYTFNEEKFTLDLDFAEVLHKISRSEGGMKEAIEEFKFEEANLWCLSSKYHDYIRVHKWNNGVLSNNQS